MSKLVIKTSRIAYISLYSFSLLLITIFVLLGLHEISIFVNLIFVLIVLLIVTHPEWFIFYYTFIVDKDRIIEVSGFINKKRITIPITSIATVTLNQSFLGRILNYGDIAVSAFGAAEIKLRGVSNPSKIINLLEEMMEKYRHPKQER